MVGEIDLRGGRRRFGIEIDVCYGRIGLPRPTGVFEIFPHTSPLVPNKDTIGSNEEESETNKDNGSNFTDVDQPTSNLVNIGGVESITKLD